MLMLTCVVTDTVLMQDVSTYVTRLSCLVTGATGSNGHLMLHIEVKGQLVAVDINCRKLVLSCGVAGVRFVVQGIQGIVAC